MYVTTSVKQLRVRLQIVQALWVMLLLFAGTMPLTSLSTISYALKVHRIQMDGQGSQIQKFDTWNEVTARTKFVYFRLNYNSSVAVPHYSKDARYYFLTIKANFAISVHYVKW